MRLRFLLPLLASVWSATAGAVIIASGDGTGNTTAPVDDPGFATVGTLFGATAVHLGGGWVLTANHVGVGNPVFVGSTYQLVSGSAVQLHNSDSSLADLRVFRVNPVPMLPALQLSASPPPMNADLVLVGRGRDRGAATSWMGFTGWLYGPANTMRWGTNRVSANNLDILGTRAFETNFTQVGGTLHESMAATGDSGGAVFHKSGGVWRLAGTLFAVGPYSGQPANTALFGNVTYAAQLADYAAELQDIVAQPVCSDGLDNDADGKFDHPADPGCQDAVYMSENPACNDGLDNDGDGKIDLADLQCEGRAWYPFEINQQSCGLGFELAGLLPALLWLRAKRRKPSAR